MDTAFSVCLDGFPPDAPFSSRSPKGCPKWLPRPVRARCISPARPSRRQVGQAMDGYHAVLEHGPHSTLDLRGFSLVRRGHVRDQWFSLMYWWEIRQREDAEQPQKFIVCIKRWTTNRFISRNQPITQIRIAYFTLPLARLWSCTYKKTNILFCAALVFVRKYVNRLKCDSIRHGQDQFISACRARLPCLSRASAHVWARAQEFLASTWLRPAFSEKVPYVFFSFFFMNYQGKNLCWSVEYVRCFEPLIKALWGLSKKMALNTVSISVA